MYKIHTNHFYSIPSYHLPVLLSHTCLPVFFVTHWGEPGLSVAMVICWSLMGSAVFGQLKRVAPISLSLSLADSSDVKGETPGDPPLSCW